MKVFPRLKKFAAVAALTSIFLQPIAPALAQEPFGDITAHWAKREIVRLSSQGLVNGYQGKFTPEGQVTRAQLATILVNALRLNDQAKVLTGIVPEFKDVPASHWAAGAITVAKENGLISGYSDKTFRPDNPVRRDELTAMLVRALRFRPDSGITRENLSFTDKNAVPDWVVGELVLAKRLGLISGYADETFRPGRFTTRAEAAVLINRLLAQQGQAFDFAGRVVEVTLAPRTITLDIHGQKETIPLSPNVLMYQNNQAVTLEFLRPGDKVLFNLNNDGKVSYIEKDDSLELVNWSGTILKSHDLTEGNQAEALRILDPLPPGTLKAKGVDRLLSNSLLLAENFKDPLINPEESLAVTKKEMAVQDFSRATGSDGRGQIIAVIDTGVDPGHPDLRTTTEGRVKVMDWVDFTTEGLIETKGTVQAIAGILPLTSGNYRVGSIVSKSGYYRYGYWNEEDSSAELDFNFNGEADSFAVLLTDNQRAGRYDTVYVDTDNDQDFTDEWPMILYRNSFLTGSFPAKDGRQFNFVVSNIDSAGGSVQLGFDGNNHGTHIAGIAAANGRIKGVAPGAQIMAIKALDSSGYGEGSSLVQAINYAVQNGAKVINLSFGFASEDRAGKSSLAQLVNRYSKEYGINFVIAAGNDGPGLTTVATPGDASEAISVGAFISPDMWRRDFGWQVADDSLWFFSSIGPRRDGGAMPTIVAPGSVVSTAPAWEANGYLFSEGTSMAAPHVAGAVALLLEKAKKEGSKATPAMIKKALEMGARELAGFSPAEQGYGVVNLSGAWLHLQLLKGRTAFTGLVYNREMDLGEGLFAQGFIPGELDLYLRSETNKHVNLVLSSDQGWFKPLQHNLVLPANKIRTTRLKYEIPNQPGIYSGRLKVDDPATFGTDLEILNTVIRPYLLNEGNDFRQSFNHKLGAGQYHRYFFEVPEGTASLNTRLTLDEGNLGFPGRARIHLFNPKGEEVNRNLIDFAGADLDSPKASVNKEVYYPQPGVWEAIVYSSATLSQYGLSESQYNFTASLGKVVQPGSFNEEGTLLIGLLPTNLKVNHNGYITLQVRDRINYRPYQGALEVNGLVYSVRDGRLTLPVKPDGISYPVVVKTILDNRNKKQQIFSMKLPVLET